MAHLVPLWKRTFCCVHWGVLTLLLPEPALLCCSIFRRPYYVSHFLPALLTPRVVSTHLHERGTEVAESKDVPSGSHWSLVFPLTDPEYP